MKLLAKLVIIALISSVCLIPRVGTSSTIQPNEGTALMYFLPLPLNVKTGQIFQVECWITGVTNLYGMDIQIGWNPTIIKHISHTKMTPVETHPDGILHRETINILDRVDESASLPGSEIGTTYWLMDCSLEPAPSFNGSGKAFVMTFQALITGNTGINFTGTSLLDRDANLIPHTAQDAQMSITDGSLKINSIVCQGTSPYPYVPSGIRPNEAVFVTANITSIFGVKIAILSYVGYGGSLWNTTMIRNAETGLWETMMPGLQGWGEVGFSIVAVDNAECYVQNATSYFVSPLPIGDLNGDGEVTILDVVLCCAHYGEIAAIE